MYKNTAHLDWIVSYHSNMYAVRMCFCLNLDHFGCGAGWKCTYTKKRVKGRVLTIPVLPEKSKTPPLTEGQDKRKELHCTSGDLIVLTLQFRSFTACWRCASCRHSWCENNDGIYFHWSTTSSTSEWRNRGCLAIHSSERLNRVFNTDLVGADP